MLYNEGRQFESEKTGYWFDVEDIEYDELSKWFIEWKLDSDPELMFTDYEGFPEELYGESLCDSEFQSIKEYAELDDTEKEGYEFLVDHMGYKHDQAIKKADDVNFSDQSPHDYAYDYIEEHHHVDEWITGFIDYYLVAQSLEMDNCIITYGDKLITNGYDF